MRWREGFSKSTRTSTLGRTVTQHTSPCAPLGLGAPSQRRQSTRTELQLRSSSCTAWTCLPRSIRAPLCVSLQLISPPFDEEAQSSCLSHSHSHSHSQSQYQSLSHSYSFAQSYAREQVSSEEKTLVWCPRWLAKANVANHTEGICSVQL